MPYQTISNHIKSYQTIPNNTKPYLTIPNHTKSHQTIPNTIILTTSSIEDKLQGPNPFLTQRIKTMTTQHLSVLKWTSIARIHKWSDFNNFKTTFWSLENFITYEYQWNKAARANKLHHHSHHLSAVFCTKVNWFGMVCYGYAYNLS